MADLIHVVLLKVKGDADASFLQTLFQDINALRSLHGVISLDVGPASRGLYEGYADRTAGYTHGLVLRVKDAQALEHYAKHPQHVSVVERLKTVLEPNGIVAFDYFAAESSCVCPACWRRSPAHCKLFGTIAIGVVLGLVLHKFVPKGAFGGLF